MEIHFKDASLSSSADEEFYLYFGGYTPNTEWVGSNAFNESVSQTVWDDNFNAVYHFSDLAVDGTTDEVKDSAGTYHGTGVTTGSGYPTPTSGGVGSYFNFDGDEYVSLVESEVNFARGAGTVECMFQDVSNNWCSIDDPELIEINLT